MPDVGAYRVRYMSSCDHPFVAEIACYDNLDASRIPYTENCFIRFFPDGAVVPADFNATIGNRTTPVLNFTLARFRDVMELLRDIESSSGVGEFGFDSATGGVSGWGLGTGPEVVGTMEP